jgi:uncharacterized protein with NAD-binding domain and iron-sulfur cluster
MVATITNFTRLPIQDRLSIAGLLYAMLDLYRSDRTFQQYDDLDAQSLFVKLGISERLINEFLRPTLLVGLFKPPEELSAAVTMELLYYYALAHQDSFDVRWIKSKSIAERSRSEAGKVKPHLQATPLPVFCILMFGGCVNHVD